MLIRKKTNDEISHDVNSVKKDIEMGIIRDDLYWPIKPKNSIKTIIKGDIYWVFKAPNYPKYLRINKKIEKQRTLFENKWILTLRICQDKVPTKNISTWSRVMVSKTIIEFWDYKEYLHLHNSLEKWDIKDLKILVQHDFWSYELDIPSPDRSGMLQYFIEWKPPIDFDCQSFVHKIKWVKMRSHTDNFSIIANKWIMEKKPINELHSGDCICLFDYFSNQDCSFNWVKHFAYYIWNGLFISKLWTGGSIAVLTLPEMHSFYETKQFVSMTPNSFHEDVIHNKRNFQQ
jgi:hypothetical protein